MGYYEMDTEVVQSTGRQVHDLAPEAAGAVQKVHAGYTTVAGEVVHAKVQAALGRFHDTHQATHRSVPHAVSLLRANTASGGAAPVDGMNESTAVQVSTLGSQQDTAMTLRRPISS